MITYNEAIKILKVSRKGMYYIIKNNKIKIIKKGRFIFIEEDELQRYIKEKEDNKLPDGYKKCNTCNKIKPEKEFKKRTCWCKECRKNDPEEKIANKRRNEKYRKLNIDKLKMKSKERYKKYKYQRSLIDKKRNYDISEKDYLNLLEQSKGLCNLCKLPKDPLCVDHNHTTNKIRGLLCRNCNIGLGNFKDNQELLKLAIIYLQQNDG